MEDLLEEKKGYIQILKRTEISNQISRLPLPLYFASLSPSPSPQVSISLKFPKTLSHSFTFPPLSSLYFAWLTFLILVDGCHAWGTSIGHTSFLTRYVLEYMLNVVGNHPRSPVVESV